MTTHIQVPFQGTTLVIVEHHREPYTPLKPIVEGMGLDWRGQHQKLRLNASRWGMEVIPIPSKGGPQPAACIPLRKLAGWLMTLHPSRVRTHLRERVLAWQNECDDALWAYWNQGARLPDKSGVSEALDAHIRRLAARLAMTQYDSIRALLAECAADNLACGASEADCMGYVEAMAGTAGGVAIVNVRDLKDVVAGAEQVIQSAAQSIAALRRVEARSGLQIAPRLSSQRGVKPQFRKLDRLVQQVLERISGDDD